jgi:transcription elongation factor GreA
MKAQPITKDGLQKIEEELRYLETTRRTEVADKIRQAKELLSTPNDAEYGMPRTASDGRGRIQQLQGLIQNAEIIDEDGAHRSKIVMLGTTVKVKSATAARATSTRSSALRKPTRARARSATSRPLGAR